MVRIRRVLRWNTTVFVGSLLAVLEFVSVHDESADGKQGTHHQAQDNPDGAKEGGFLLLLFGQLGEHGFSSVFGAVVLFPGEGSNRRRIVAMLLFRLVLLLLRLLWMLLLVPLVTQHVGFHLVHFQLAL